MAGLQRSEISFRRSGSSGLVWEDKFLSEELNNKANSTPNTEEPELDKAKSEEESAVEAVMQRSRSDRERPAVAVPYRTMKVASPPLDPPSPKAGGGCCGGVFDKAKTRHQSRRQRFGKRK